MHNQRPCRSVSNAQDYGPRRIASCLTFQLEGRLAGRWVQELKNAGNALRRRSQEPIVRVDLAGVTFVDAEGEACLVALHQQGAELVAADCLTKAIVDEITQGQPRNSNGPK